MTTGTVTSIPHVLCNIMWVRRHTVQLYLYRVCVPVWSSGAKMMMLCAKQWSYTSYPAQCRHHPSEYCANQIKTVKAFNWRLPDCEYPREHISTEWLTAVAGCRCNYVWCLSRYYYHNHSSWPTCTGVACVFSWWRPTCGCWDIRTDHVTQSKRTPNVGL